MMWQINTITKKRTVFCFLLLSWGCFPSITQQMYCFLKSAAKVKFSSYNKLKTNLIFHTIGKIYAVLLIINVFFNGIICSFPPKKTLPFALAIGYWRWEGKKDPYIYKVYRGARKSASFFVFSKIIKILFPCTSLVSYLVLPRELREKTEGRPKEDRKNSPPTKSAFS